jgi:phosphoesterase RecJ-like protein
MNIYKAIFNEIRKFKKIYIARHIGPDPDAFGSQMALKDSIIETFPDKEVYAVGTTVAKFKYLGKVDKVSSFDYENSLLIAVDIPDKKRIDIEGFDNFKNIIKIDHHPFEDKMGKVEWVDETSSSTAQLVTQLVMESNLKLTKGVAENLFLGIVSDSDRFLLSYTSKDTFYIVGKLIEKSKIDFTKLYNKFSRM